MQCGRPRFNSWVGKIPREGHGNPLQYSCLENPHGQRILAGYNSRGRKESDTTEWLSTAQHSWCQKRKETTERAGLRIILIRFNQLAISLSYFKSGKVRRLQLRFKVVEYLSQSKLCFRLSFLRSLLSLFVRMGNSYTFHPFSYTRQPFQWADSLSPYGLSTLILFNFMKCSVYMVTVTVE